MDTAQVNHPKKTVSRVFAVSAALGIALAAGATTAASAVAATPARHVVTNAATAHASPTGGQAAWRQHDGRDHGDERGHGHDDDDDCSGLIVLICH